MLIIDDERADIGVTSLQEAISLFTTNRTINYLTIVATTLLAYDTSLTFDQEVRCIWRRKWSAVTLLYTALRYVTLLNMIWRCILSLTVFPDVKNCRIYNDFSILFMVVSFTGIQVFNWLRVWAISGKDWRPTLVVFILGLFEPCANIYINALPVTYILIKSGPFAQCWLFVQAPIFQYLPIIIRSTVVLADVIALAVTVAATYRTYRQGELLSRGANITSLMLQNGVLQFVMFSALNIINVIFDILNITTELSDISQVIIISEALSAIIICRFLLDLRSIYPSNDAPWSSSSSGHPRSTESSVRFAPSILGNIGAPLHQDSLFASIPDGSFRDRYGDDGGDHIAPQWEAEGEEVDEKPIYSDVPLEAAYLSQVEERDCGEPQKSEEV